MADKQIKRVGNCYYNPLTHTWAGLPTPPLYNPNQSIGQLILTMLQRCDPQHVTQISADIDQGRPVTCREMYLRTVRIAEHLRQLGYGKKTPMAALASRNGEHVAPVMFACFVLGIPVNTLDVTFNVTDFEHMFNVTRPVLLFCESNILSVVREAAERSKIEPQYILFEDYIDGYQHVLDLMEPTGTEDLFEPAVLDDPSTHIAVILCSSGTTGLPKGVNYSHSFCVANLPSLWYMSPNDRILAFSSLYWLSGFASLIIGTIAQASRVITREPFTPQLAVDMIEHYRVTIAFFTSYQSNLLIHERELSKKSLPLLRLVLCGGSRVSKQLYASMRMCLPSHTLIQIGYGMSECCLISMTDGINYRDDCVGTLQARAEARVLDDETGQRSLPPGEPGEIVLRVQFPFSGYYGNVAATADIMGSDGWIHSGDIGYFDSDGYLYIVDRKKDIIKYANFQISPTELETLIKQLPGVLECCVVGVPDEGTDLPAALIIRAPGLIGDAISAKQVQQFVNEAVSHNKRLRGGVYFTSELPLTPSGKIVRRKCLEILLNIRESTQ